MGENTLYLDFPGNEVKPIFGSDQVCAYIASNIYKTDLNLQPNISAHLKFIN